MKRKNHLGTVLIQVAMPDRMSRVPTALYIFLVVVLALTAKTARADSIAAQFSITSNPNGNWSYGYTTTLGGAFSPFTISSTAVYAPGVSGWEGPFPFADGASYPLVVINTTGSTISYRTVVQPPGVLGLHPGPSGQYSVVRWKALSSGTFLVSGSWIGIEQFPATSDVHILLNGAPFFNSTVTVVPGLALMNVGLK